MGLEWIDTWAGLAGFVAVVAWIGNQNRQIRKFLEQRIDRAEADLKAEIAQSRQEIAQGRQDLRESEKRILAFVNKQLDDVNKRFDDVNQRFDDVNQRFDDVNKRFGDINKRFDDFKDFVLMRIDGSARRRVAGGSEAASEQGRRATRQRSR